MGYIFDCSCWNFFTILLSILVCIIAYFKWSFGYWKRKNIPYIEPQIPWGTLGNILFDPKSIGEATLNQYAKAKQNGHKVIGLYGFSRPIAMFNDPVLIKRIMSTDFKYFTDRGVYINEKDDPLSAHLFALEGIKWRNLRVKLTPTFTTGKIKMMFNILAECGDQLKEAVDKICDAHEPIDIKEILARFTTNIIGSAAFGLECNTFAAADSDFRKYGKKIFNTSKTQQILGLIGFVNRKLANRLGIRAISRDAGDFFLGLIKETVAYREKNNIERNDFLQLLIHLKNEVPHENTQIEDEIEQKHDGKRLTIEELAAQAFVFFVAGFETSSTTMTFCLFELALNTDLQERVRQEVEETTRAHDGQLTYEAIHEMKYMGQVIDETLRKYPPLAVLFRTCNEDYKIPDTDMVIEEGTSVFIPVVGLQLDEDYFPNPDKFDPDRFSEENKHNIVPYTYMPFGEGPRICIGVRFGLLQTKMGLAVLLKNYKFSLNAKTKIPLVMDPASFIQSTLGDMWLNVEKI